MTTRFKDHILTQGTLAARPAATAVPAGTLYPATDTALIYRSDGAAWATWATLTSSAAASGVSFTPAGDLASTNVQAALQELDTEKAAAASNLMQLRKSGSQTLVSYTFTAITFDTEDYDTLGLHDNVTNNSRVTIPVGQAGLYEFTAMVVISGGVGPYYLQFYKNGVAHPGRVHETAAANGYADVTLTRMLVLAAGDYVEIKADNESGANRTIEASVFAGEARTVLTARRLGPTPL